MFAKIHSIALTVVIALLMGGCMTPYQPNGATGGYIDQKIDARIYRVGFYGNGHTPRDRVFRFWLYRCAELTIQNGYESFSIIGRQRTNPPGAARVPRNEYGLDADAFTTTRTAGYVPSFVYIPGGGAVTKYSANGYIRMYLTEVDSGNEPFFRARKVLADLANEIKQGDPPSAIAGAYDPDIALGRPASAVTASNPVDKPTLEDLKDLLPAGNATPAEK